MIEPLFDVEDAMNRTVKYLSQFAGGEISHSCRRCNVQCTACDLRDCTWCKPVTWNSFYCPVVGCNVRNKNDVRNCTSFDILKYLMENL